MAPSTHRRCAMKTWLHVQTMNCAVVLFNPSRVLYVKLHQPSGVSACRNIMGRRVGRVRVALTSGHLLVSSVITKERSG